MSRRLLLSFLLLLALTAIGHAETRIYPRAQIAFTVPDAWSTREEAHTFVATDAKRESAVIFKSLPAKDVKDATEMLTSRIADTFSDVKWGSKAQTRSINGLKAAVLEGTGKYKNQLVDLLVYLVVSPTGRVVQVTAFVQSDKRIDHRDTLVKILASLKPAVPKVQRQTIAEAQLSLELPVDWRAETKGKVRLLSHPSGDASVSFVPLDASDLKAAGQAVESKVAELFSDVKWATKGVEKRMNGLKAWVLEGTGKHDGELANLWVAAIVAPNGKVVLSVIRVNADMRVSYLPTVRKIFKSFGPPV